jgi:hypothetical protein
MQTTVDHGNHKESGKVYTLAELIDLRPKELSELYANARVPNLSAIRGDLRGRMLSWADLPNRANGLLMRLARSSVFPWRGKSFTPREEAHGEGVNRVLLDRFKLFRFDTFVGPSRAGPFDAVQLDYDKPGNPALIRAIKDEIRELSPGLYLGQAYLMRRGAPHLVLYFGLEG